MNYFKKFTKFCKVYLIHICILLIVSLSVTVGVLCYALTEQHYVYDYYTVQKGDTLWGIARKVAGDENAIEPVLYAIGRDNGIDSHIYPGEVIMIRKAVD